MFKFVDPPKDRTKEVVRELDIYILRIIEWWYDHNSEPITVRTISKQLTARNLGGTSTSTVHRGLTRLEDMGYIRKVNGEVRLTSKQWRD